MSHTEEYCDNAFCKLGHKLKVKARWQSNEDVQWLGVDLLCPICQSEESLFSLNCLAGARNVTTQRDRDDQPPRLPQ